MAARDPLPKHSAETACGEGASAGVASPVRRQKRVTQTKRHPNVFLKHKLKYKKKSSTQEDSSCSSTESERSTPTSRPQPPVTCVPAATADSRCCCSAELCQRGLTPAQSGRGAVTQLPAEPVGAVPLLPAAVAAPRLHSSSSVTSVQAASGDPLSSNFFNSIPSVSSSLSSASSRSSGASAEKEGSDSCDSLVSVKAVQRSAEKEASDSSDSLASGASATRKSIKKLIRNKYDIFRRHKLKYRRLLGKSDRRADLPLDRAGGGSSCSNGRDSAGSLVAARCPANDGRDDSASQCGGSSGSSSSSSSGCSSAGSAPSAVGDGGHHPVTTAHLPGPRGLPHNPLLHSSSDGSRSSSSSSSSLQSSSSSARSSRDTGFVDKGRERERRRRRHTSPAVINRVVPLMVMMQRQTVACDAGSATLMFKCNMCNMFSTTMQNVLAHISEHHATAQYCFDCESFFPDSQSLDSHLSVGCQGGCSVSRTGSDAALPDEGSESQPSPSPSPPPSPPPSSGFCRKAAALATAGAKPLAGGAGGRRGGGGIGGSSVSSVGCVSEASPSLAARCSEGGSGVPSSCTTVERSTESRPRLLRSQPQLPECPQGSKPGGSADVSGHRSDPLASLCSTASLPSGNSAPGGSESLSSSVTVASSAPSCGSSSGRHAIADVASDAGKEHRCRLCSKEFLGLCYLKRHMRSHTGEKICFCPTCHRGFSEWRNLRNHIARFHGSGGSGDCGSDLMAPAASRSASSDGGSGGGSSASTGGLSEAQPGEPFAGGSSAGSVEEAMEDAEPLLSCSIEPTTESAADPDADGGDPLQYSTMHLGSTSSRLELNSDETFRKKALTPHNCVGGLRRTYHCEPCSKDFVTKFAMQRHLDFHADKRPFHCDMCSYKSKTKPQLKVHQMRHKGQKVYHCDLCNYDCVTHSDLNRHCKSMSHKSRHGSSTVSSS